MSAPYGLLMLGCGLVLIAALWAFWRFLQALWERSAEPDYTADEADAFIRGERPHWRRSGP